MRRNSVSLEAVNRAARVAVIGCAVAAALVVSAAMLAGVPPLAVVAATALTLLGVSWAS
jgi:hypothetical protein